VLQAFPSIQSQRLKQGVAGAGIVILLVAGENIFIVSKELEAERERNVEYSFSKRG
jgi:hypothetical protein